MDAGQPSKAFNSLKEYIFQQLQTGFMVDSQTTWDQAAALCV